jgi:hypothetical protein
MATVTAGHHSPARNRFELHAPRPNAWLALGVITGGAIIALIYGFSVELAIITLAAIPVLYALNALAWRANNYVILHDQSVDLKIWELGDFGPGLKIPYEAITAVRVHPTDDLLQVRFVYDDGEPSAATVQLRTREEALNLADEINRQRKSLSHPER